MVSKVIERPSYTVPSPGSESSFIAQLLQTTQQHGYAINQLIGLLEAGTFTPTLTFATPGDLSVVYTTQLGFFWRVGPLVFFSLTLNCTPTFTTASGAAQILGLPHAAFPDAVSTVLGGVQFGAAGLTYPAGRSTVFAFINASEDFIRLAASGSAVGTTSIQATAFATGVSTSDMRVQGFYPTDDVEGF